MKAFLKSLLFIAIGLSLFICVQNIMVPDHQDVENQERTMNGFEVLNKDSVDVLVVGGSTMSYGALPMELYDDYQIRSYNLSSSGQPTECSYYLAKYAFETQSPKIVVLDAGPVIQSDNKYSDGQKSFFWWNLFNHLPMGKVKWEMAQAYDQMSYSDGVKSVLFPIMKYHSRWSQLTAEDFTWPKKELHYAGGAFVNPTFSGPALSKEHTLYEENEALARSEGYITSISNGETQPETGSIDTRIYAPVLTEEKREYLLKFKQMCEENGAQLILLKIPSYSHINNDPWTQEKSSLLQTFADESSIPFYDYSLDYDIVDSSTDFSDGGVHVNARGGRKVSAALGALLRDTYQCMPNPDAQYDSMLADYKKVIDVVMLETETNFSSYVEHLAEKKEDYTIYISAANEYTLSMTPEDYALLEEKLGLRLISQGQYTDSYLAVLDSGELLYEAVSNRRIDHQMTVNGQSVRLASCGWFSGPASSVVINGKDYAGGASRGLHFVVFDKESGTVIDSVAFDTYATGKTVSRPNAQTLSFLRAYESAVCF